MGVTQSGEIRLVLSLCVSRRLGRRLLLVVAIAPSLHLCRLIELDFTAFCFIVHPGRRLCFFVRMIGLTTLLPGQFLKIGSTVSGIFWVHTPYLPKWRTMAFGRFAMISDFLRVLHTGPAFAM